MSASGLRVTPAQLAAVGQVESEVTCYSVPRAAELLGTTRETFLRLCREHGIQLFRLDGPRSTRITHDDLLTLIRLRKSAAGLSGQFQD